MPTMTNRSNRLRLVVKQSGKTAKDIINTFAEMEKNKPQHTVKYPKDPITISRHINAKRSFDIDMAVAYAKALDADPAEICFEPVKKNIWGSHEPMNGSVTWFTDYSGYTSKELKQVIVPRNFYNERYKVIEDINPQAPSHGSLIIYEQIHKNGNQVNRDFFNSICLCQYKKDDKPNSVQNWVMGVPRAVANNRFDIQLVFGSILLRDVKLITLYPVVTVVLPTFYRFQKDY
tara:strand:- start:2932 stop:3627 length:696 start_codon:yes stop_codon:yes gene_type:complete